MAPTVMPGDPIEVVPAGRLRAGDAVVFRTSDVEVLHRLIFKLPLLPYVVHRGDAHNARVGLAHCSHIVGRADLPRRRPMLRERIDGCLEVARRAPAALRKRLGRAAAR